MPHETDERRYFRGAYRDSDGKWHFSGHAEDLVAQAKLEMAGALGRRTEKPQPPVPPQPAAAVRAPQPAPPPRPAPEPRAAGTPEAPSGPSPATEPGSAKIASVAEGLAALGNLYEAFYGKWARAGRRAEVESPLIKEIEAETLTLGAEAEEINRLRREVMRRTGYADLLPAEKPKARAGQPAGKASITVTLKSGEQMPVAAEDLPAYERLLEDLMQRQKSAGGNPKLTATIAEVRNILAQARSSGL